MSIRDDPDWAEDHGYYHWKCRYCGMAGWTDTTPDCACCVGKYFEEAPDDDYEIGAEEPHA